MARAPSNIVYLESPEKGVDGRGILTLARDPLISDGRIGDFIIQSVTKKLYGPKNAGGWPDLGLIRGSQGWAPKLVAEADGTRRVFKISDWTGGEGAKPATGYLAADGTVVAEIGDAADFRGAEGPQALINALDAKTDSVTYETLTALAESASDNEKAAIKRVFEPGNSLPVGSLDDAGALTIPAVIKRAVVDGRDYIRTPEEPTDILKFRSSDRWTDEGNSDSANGGWWKRDDQEGRRDIREFGVIGDGIMDDTAALIRAFQNGGSLWVPEGEYLIAAAGPSAGGVYAYITRSIDVLCHARAVFKTNGLDHDMINLRVPPDGIGLPDDLITVVWQGGFIDQSAQKNSTVVPNASEFPPANPGASSTCDGLSISGWYIDNGVARNGIRRADVIGLRTYAGEHWQTAGGDSGILIGAGIDLVNVERCSFKGNRDVAVYASTYEGLTSGRVNVRQNHFDSCFNGASFKRSIDGFECSQNTFVNCVQGAQTNYLNGSSGRPRGGTISENNFVRCLRSVRLDYSENVHVLNNLSELCGSTDAGGDTVTLYSDLYAIVLFGATNCTVKGNRARSVNAAYSAMSFRHVGLSSITANSVEVLSTGNLIEENVSDGLYSAGIEASAKANSNWLLRNYNFNPSLGGNNIFQRQGSFSFEERADMTNMQRIFMQPLLFDDNANAVMLGRRSQPSTGIYFSTNLVGWKIGGSARLWGTNVSVGAALPIYADDAAAGAGGLSAGLMYRTTAGEVRIKT